MNSPGIDIRHCVVDCSATDAIDASGSPNLCIEYCSINHSLNDAISLDMGCRFAQVTHNQIKNTGLLPGMGESGTGSYQALSMFGDSSIAEDNEIDSTGYNAIYFGGNGATVRNNRVDYFCSVKDDGAGIYVGDWRVTKQKKIIGNIIFNGAGASAEGIYIDDNSSGVDIQKNYVANCPDAGIKIHNAHEANIEGNILFNNGIQLLIAEDTFSSHSSVRNITCSGNTFLCKSAGQLCLNIISTSDDLDFFVQMGGYQYYRPGENQEVIRLVSKIWSSAQSTRYISLSQWQEKYKQEPKLVKK